MWLTKISDGTRDNSASTASHGKVGINSDSFGS